MSYDALTELIERRSTVAEQLKSVYKDADERPEGERNLTAEEVQTEERLSAELDQIENRQKNLIKDLETAQKAEEARSRFSADPADKPNPAAEEMRQLVEHIREERTGEFVINPSPADVRSTGLDRPTAGGAAEIVPVDTLFNQIWDLIEDRSMILQAGARIFNTSTGTPMSFTKKTARSGSQWVGEGNVIPTSQPGTDKLTLTSHKNAVIVPMTNELGRDAVFNAGAWVMADGTEELTRGIEEGLVAGSGTGDEPSGIALAPAGHTVAQGGAFDFNDVLELIHSVPSAARRGSQLFINDTSIKEFRALKDNEGRYLWQPSHQLGEPDTMLGYAIHQDPHLATLADPAGSVVGVFGNMSGFLIRRVGGISIRRDESYLFDTDEVAYRFTVHVDSGVLDERIIKTLRTV